MDRARRLGDCSSRRGAQDTSTDRLAWARRRTAAGGGGCRRNAGVVAGDRAGQKAPPPRLDPDTRAGHNGLITASAGSQSNWPASRRCCRQIVTAATPALPLYRLPLRWCYLSTGYLSDGATSLPATSPIALPLHRLPLRWCYLSTGVLPLYPLPLRWRYLSTGYLSDDATSLPATSLPVASPMALPLYLLHLCMLPFL